MVTFCGKNESDLSVARGALANDCFVDGLNMIPHILFLLICIPILFIWNLSYYGKMHTLSWVHFQGHYLRWIITLILLFLHLCEIGEGVLSGTYLNEFRLHPIIPPCVALIGALFSIVFYHNVEMWNSSRFLLALLLYWSFALTTKGLKIKMMLSKGVGLEHLRLNLTMCVIVVYFIIILVELNVLRSQRYAFLRRPIRLHPSMEMVHIRYMHPFVNLLSKAVFWWVNEILFQGHKRPLEITDLGLLPSDHQAQKQMNRLSYVYKEEMKKLKNQEDVINIWKVYFLSFWPMLVLSGIFKFVSDMLSFVGPLAITGIINYVVQIQDASTSNSTKTALNTMEDSAEFLITFGEFIKNGYVLTVIVVLVNILQHVFLQTSFHLSIVEGIHIRAAIQGIVYQKALHMSSWSVTSGKTSFGQIANLVSVDTSNMMFLFFMGHYIWTSPLQVLITLVLLYRQMGVSSLIASTILILIVPVQYALANTLAKIQSKTLTHADERLKKTSEMLNGIKLLKLYGWEKLFCNLIEQIRFKEMACIKRTAICNIFINFITVSGPILVTLTCFGIYPFIEKENLNSGGVFSALALFNLLTIPLFMFPMLVKIIVNAKVSSHRLVKFMAIPDIENPSDLDDLQDSVVEFKSINGSIELHVPDADFLHHSNRSSRRGSTVSTASRRHSNISLPENEIVHTNDGLKELLIVEFKGANLSWDLDSKNVDLKNINLQIPLNKLTLVVGPVGSGKSSLLSALLGEMCTVSGSVEWERTLAIAYVPQTPWILNATFQDNILFGQAYDQQRYNRVVRACSLQADMDILPAGDKTEIGQKGVNLSGGQKQRIGIARALYSKCRIVFMDDPLSALDSHVALHVFQEGILRILMKQKRTVVLVTHHLQYLNFAHMIVVMNNGYATHQGTMDEIKINDPEMYENWQKIIHVKHHNDSEPNKVTKDRQKLRRMVTIECQCGGLKVKEPVEKSSRADIMRQISISSQNFEPLPCDEHIHLDTCSYSNDKKLTTLNDTATLEESSVIDPPKDSKKNKIEKGKLISKEERATGSVSWHMYVLYIKACSIFISLLTLLLTFAQQGTKIGTDFWLSEWSSSSDKTIADDDSWQDNYSVKEIVNNSDWIFQAQDTSPDTLDSNLVYYLTGYSLLSLTGITLALLSSGGFAISSLKAARKLHSKLITTIVQCPMRFFDTTPLGRILNRFSSDMSVVDEKLGFSIYLMVRSFVLCLAGLIVNSIVTPIFLIPLLPFLILYYLLQKFYRLSAIEVQRLDSISKSPLFAHFSESLGGLSTIRAYNAERRFKRKMLECIDVNNTSFLFLHAINRWLGIRLDFIGDIIVFISALGSITVALFNIIPPSYVGLALTYSLQMSGSINWLVRTLTDTELFMSSVERLNQYITLPIENYQSLVVPSTDPMQEIVTTNRAPPNWPNKGEVEMKEVSLRYDSSLDPVVRKISLQISAGEKVGICGRTGSGKSSLTLGLFRMIEICEGKILLDGIDISTVPLLKLRSKIAIIPQDPVLFSGTIRLNLDIEHKYTDEELWHVLELSQLKYHISNLAHQLDTEISEGGENFSLGQKQLFCLARAILKNAQILVMDEATSSLDAQTDQIIQTVIEEEFADKTVISIAHRVTSLLNFDTIVVLDAGIIAEYGPPRKLLEKEEGIFASLVRAAEK